MKYHNQHKSYKIFFVLLITIMLCSCTLRQDITQTIDSEFNQIRESSPDISSDILLHTAEYVPYSATGGCASTFSEYWYGTQKNNINIDEAMEKNSWILEKAGWHKIDGNKHLFLSLFLYNDSTEIAHAPLVEQLPNDVLKKAENYNLIYNIVLRLAVNTSECPVE